MSTKAFLKLLIKALEIIVAFIATKITGVIFFKTYFCTAIASSAIVLLIILFTTGYKETMLTTMAAVLISALLMSLDFILPWLIATIFELEFFKTFTVTYLILSFISVITTKGDIMKVE